MPQPPIFFSSTHFSGSLRSKSPTDTSFRLACFQRFPVLWLFLSLYARKGDADPELSLLSSAALYALTILRQHSSCFYSNGKTSEPPGRTPPSPPLSPKIVPPRDTPVPLYIPPVKSMWSWAKGGGVGGVGSSGGGMNGAILANFPSSLDQLSDCLTRPVYLVLWNSMEPTAFAPSSKSEHLGYWHGLDVCAFRGVSVCVCGS